MRHVAAKLRHFMGTDQEIEFTVDRGILSILQARAAEVALDEGRVNFDDPGEEATRGIGIRGGGFRGVAAFSREDFEELDARHLEASDEVDGILMIMENPTPEDIPLILSASGLLTVKGGSTSHAAIAINGFQRRPYTAVMSAVGLRVDARKHQAAIVDSSGTTRHVIRKGDLVSIHGTSGMVYIGSRPLMQEV
jgi:pyruvate,orthophosphate dikinase